jgi:hypothetical protein
MMNFHKPFILSPKINLQLYNDLLLHDILLFKSSNLLFVL